MEWEPSDLPVRARATRTLTAQRDLLIYWSHVRNRAIRLTKQGLVRKRVMRSINECLLVPDAAVSVALTERDAVHLRFMRLILQELGLLIQEQGALHANSPAGQVPHFWRMSLVQRVTACLEAWRCMKGWSELSSLRLSSLELDLPGARHKLLQELRTLPVMEWLSAERFSNRLIAQAPPLLFAVQDHAQSRSGSPGAVATNNGRLGEIEAVFVAAALSGPLHWLGLIDVLADGERLLALRVNVSGAQALGLVPVDESQEPSQGQLIVQPNFRVFALGPVSDAVLAYLEIFAERVKADESAFEYVLLRERAYTAQRHGFSISQLAAFLEEESSFPVPSNVQRTLLEWERQQERIVVHRAVSLCEASEPQLLDQLWADGTIRLHMERRLAPTAALIRRGQTTALQEALLQHDILPTLSPADEPCTNRVQMMPDGELCPIRMGPDLLLEACLRCLAEERSGRYYITEEAVKAALLRGMGASEYLEQLSALHHGPMPPELRARIEAWAGGRTQAYLRQAILLELEDSSTTEDLLSEPEIAPLLSRFPEDPSGRLLLVHTDDRERLRRALAARGVELIS
jgi:DNA-binding transcriptional MerR regulator